MSNLSFKITNLALVQRCLMKQFIEPGDTVIDATLGNGYDSEYLLELIGKTGRLYAFDIQESAVISAKKRLLKFYGYNITYYNTSHENIDLIAPGVKAVVYNLGYLPGYKHSVTTKAKSTLNSVNKAMDLLVCGGCIYITAYLKHDGCEEYCKLSESFKILDSKKFKVLKIDPYNQDPLSPKLFIIQKYSNQE